MVKRVNREWCACVQGFRDDFIVDTPDDFANLPKAATGSMAVAPNGDVMVVNASGEWVKFGG